MTNSFPVNIPEKTERLLGRLHEKIESRKEEICRIKSRNIEDSSLILCSYGAMSRSCDPVVNQARNSGLKIGSISLKTIWPFPDFFFKQLPSNVKTIVVCELNMGQIVREVERVSCGRFNVVRINTIRGTMITPQEILDKINEIIK